MKKKEAIKQVLDYVLETERDYFHRTWVPEALKGLSLKESYELAKDEAFCGAVIGIWGVREFKRVIKLRWEEINKIPKKGCLTEDHFDQKYTPNTNLKSECFDDESGRFETFGTDLETVLAHDKKYVWTCVEGDEGTYYISGYHLVNRIYYLITNEPWDQEEEYLLDGPDEEE